MIKTKIEITCDCCYKDLSDEVGFAILGNIHVTTTKEDNTPLYNTSLFKGVGGGLIGNNLEDEGVVVRASHYCKECLISILDRA